METLSFSQLQSLIVFTILIILFSWQGYQRGFLAEIVKMVLIVFGIAIGNPAILGTTVIRIINNLWEAFLFLINGGLVAVASGNLDAETIAGINSRVGSKPPLIPPDNAQLAMFLFMLALILLGYLIGSRIKSKQKTLLGLFFGLVNGLLLAYVFLPLLPEELPPLPTGLSGQTTMASGLWGVFTLAIQILLTPLYLLFSNFNTWFIPIMIVAIIVVIGLRGVRSR